MRTESKRSMIYSSTEREYTTIYDFKLVQLFTAFQHYPPFDPFAFNKVIMLNVIELIFLILNNKMLFSNDKCIY